jgi:hypothetical protein
MNKNSQNMRSRSAELLGAICGGLLIGFPAIPLVAIAQQQPNGKTNPCPKIFYEEPHNSEVAAPQGCPPNDYTRMNPQGSQESSSDHNSPKKQSFDGENSNGSTSRIYNSSQSSMTNSGDKNDSSSQQTQSSVTQTSSPQHRAAAVAIVTPTNGRVSVKLVNQTNAPISYQAIGDTAPRILQGKSNVTLQGLHMPATVTFHREDGGLLMVTPQASFQQGSLQLTLQETTDLRMDRSALRIEENGLVYLN